MKTAIFKTIDDFKRAAEFFPAGRIIPQRILKGPRKVKSLVTFGCDCWAFPTPRGYVLAADVGSTGCFIILKHMKMKNARFYGSPYFSGRKTSWFGNFGLTNEEWIWNINNAL